MLLLSWICVQDEDSCGGGSIWDSLKRGWASLVVRWSKGAEVWFNAVTPPPENPPLTNKDRILILWKAYRSEWGDAERGLFTDSRSTTKKEEEGWAGVLLRTCHISGGWGVGGGVERAGRAEGGKTGIHWHNGQNFLQQLLATSQALFLQDGAQKELAGGVVSLFPM